MLRRRTLQPLEGRNI